MSDIFNTIRLDGEKIVLTEEQDDYVRDIANAQIIMLHKKEFERIYIEEKQKLLKYLNDLFK
jgi:hypothetical protein